MKQEAFFVYKSFLNFSEFEDVAAKCLCHGGCAELKIKVQHQAKVLSWEQLTIRSPRKNATGLPVFMKTGNRSAKLLQLWIARHRASLAS